MSKITSDVTWTRMPLYVTKRERCWSKKLWDTVKDSHLVLSRRLIHPIIVIMVGVNIHEIFFVVNEHLRRVDVHWGGIPCSVAVRVPANKTHLHVASSIVLECSTPQIVDACGKVAEGSEALLPRLEVPDNALADMMRHRYVVQQEQRRATRATGRRDRPQDVRQRTGKVILLYRRAAFETAGTTCPP